MFALNLCGWQWVDRGLGETYDFPASDFIADGVWREKDLSSVIRKGVKLLSFSLGLRTADATRQMAFRTAGQENTKNIASVYTQEANRMVEHTLWVLTDAEGKVEYVCSRTTWDILQFFIRGWFKK